MTDPALDMSIDVMEAQAKETVATPIVVDPWLERRGLGFGASEVAALLLALGRRDATGCPKYMVENAAKLFAVKAGLRKPSKVGSAAREGTRSELALFNAWAADEDAAPRSFLTSLHYSTDAPRSWFPLVDRHEPRLTCTPDGWGVDVSGADVMLELKCSARRVATPHWYWVTQVQAQLAVSGCEWGVVVIGDEWAATWREPGPIHSHVVERDEAAIAEIRAAVDEGWQRVEALRGGAK